MMVGLFLCRCPVLRESIFDVFGGMCFDSNQTLPMLISVGLVERSIRMLKGIEIMTIWKVYEQVLRRIEHQEFVQTQR